MKKTLTLTLFLAALASSQAGVVLSDTFSYGDGILTAVSGGIWSAHSGGGAQSVQVTNGQIKLYEPSSSAEDVNANIGGAPYLSSDSSAVLYSSYTIILSNTVPNVLGTYFSHFRGTNTSTATDFGARVFACATNTITFAPVPAGKFRLSIANGSVSDPTLFGQLDQDLDTNTFYTVVTRFVPSTGVATIWINPSTESDTSATATDPGTVARPNPFNVFTYAFRQGSGGGFYVYVDNLKVGTSFNDVAGANTAPLISGIPNQTTPASTATGPIAFTVQDAETPASGLTIWSDSSNTGLVPTNNIVFGGSDTNRTVTLTPVSSVQGQTTVTLYVSDGVNTSSTSFVLGVGMPTISAIANQIGVTNTPVPAIPFTVNDAESDPLTFYTASSNPTVLNPANILVAGSGASRTVTLSPEPDQSGVTTVTISVTDGYSTNSSSFQLTIRPLLGVLLQDQFAYTSFNFYPNSLYDAVGSPWQTESGTAYQVQVTNGWAYLNRTNTEDVAALLANGPFASNLGVVFYTSFTLRETALPSAGGNYFAHLKDSATGTTFRSKIFAATGGAAAGSYRIGIANQANVGAYFPLDCSLGTDYLVVARYNSGTGEAVLWVNPLSEASPSTVATDSPVTSQVGAYGLREDTGIGTLQISNLVVSTSFPNISVPVTAPITITGIIVSGGTVTVNFDAGNSDAAAGFDLTSAGAVTGSYAAASATITSPSTGKFQAATATSGDTQFYKIKRK